MQAKPLLKQLLTQRLLLTEVPSTSTPQASGNFIYHVEFTEHEGDCKYDYEGPDEVSDN